VEALRGIDEWPVDHAAAAVVTGDGVVSAWGAADRTFAWASVTKLATALVALVAAEEGTIELDGPAGPEGSTIRHLLAHASGLPPEDGPPLAAPGTRRIYSNHGFDVLAATVATAAEMPFPDYFSAALRPVSGLELDLVGSAGSGAQSAVGALAVLARELLSPTLVGRETLDEATAVQFPGLVGVLPGFGRMDPNDWGLGLELRDGKAPHWTGEGNSPRTYGHFGASGTFLWVDPDADVALACLTDRPFGDWARDLWPGLSDAVLAEAAAG
jgi:CubicO group peptidase (beta-lactamase class C family)